MKTKENIQKVTMKSLIILSVILTIIASVQSQTTGNSTLPKEVLTSLQILKSDLHQMRSTGSWDAQKIVADLTAIGTTIQSKIDTMPDNVKKNFEQLQSRFQALQNGTADGQMVREAVHKSFQLIEFIYPGTKEILHEQHQNGKNPTTPSV